MLAIDWSAINPRDQLQAENQNSELQTRRMAIRIRSAEIRHGVVAGSSILAVTRTVLAVGILHSLGKV